MKQVFKKAIEQIKFGGDIVMVVYHYYKEERSEYTPPPKRDPELIFEEFINFIKVEGFTKRRMYFSFTKAEEALLEEVRKSPDIEKYREDFAWAKANINRDDLLQRQIEAQSSGIVNTMLGGNEARILIARKIMNDPTIKYKSDKIKSLLKEEFNDTEVHEIMNKREDMVCVLSYIANIHKGLLNGTIK